MDMQVIEAKKHGKKLGKAGSLSKQEHVVIAPMNFKSTIVDLELTS